MRIYEITNRTPECLAELLAVWERSVRATHTFLSESEILRIRGYVPQALAAVPQLAVLAEDGRLLGFLGAGEGRLEMLFLDRTPGAGPGARAPDLRPGTLRHPGGDGKRAEPGSPGLLPALWLPGVPPHGDG